MTTTATTTTMVRMRPPRPGRAAGRSEELTSQVGRVLVVDDDPDGCAIMEESLGAVGHQVRAVGSAQEALSELAAQDFDVVLTDFKLRGMDGIELCGRISDSRPDVPVILVTGYGTLDAAVAAMRAGAYDFITKPIEPDTVLLAVRRAVQTRLLSQEVRRLRQTVAEVQGFGQMIGRSPEMVRLYNLLSQVADTTASVVITGETGTGKELVARVLHQRGPRAKGPFVGLNCAALPVNLLESELFGHEKGAFTDAKAKRTGLFVEANGGTIFLDEIGTLPLELQPKLLRALEGRTVRPVGSNTEIPFEARVIAATNEDLEALVKQGRFREDLYFRINVIHIKIPPLRARANDILLLAQHFIDQYSRRTGKRVAGLSSPAAERLLSYEWPGNIRELQNCMERAVALTQFEQVVVEDLPERVQDYKPSRMVLDVDRPDDLIPLDEVERRYILRVLKAMKGNKAETARVLGLDRKTLYRKLERYGELHKAG